MAALLVKHSTVPTFSFLVSEVSFVKRKISLLFEISRYFFPSHEDYAIIPINMSSRDKKTKELKRISDSGNQRKLSLALAKKQWDEVRGHNVCTEGVIHMLNNFY